MTYLLRPFRSVLYIPGANARAVEKARALAADAVIFDLEDAVAPDAKLSARALLCDALCQGGFGARTRLVRVNGLDTEWGRGDLLALEPANIDAVLLPKVDGASDIDAVANLVSGCDFWAMIETSNGVMRASEIAAHARVSGLVMGTNDLAKELRSRPVSDRGPLITALQLTLLGARSQGVICVDGVYNAFKDDEGLQKECHQGRDLGFDGKTLIHPAQIDIANDVFAPDDSEANLARRQIAAFEAARDEGKGVAVVDGRIVENLHIETARATLAKIDAIKSMEP